MECYECEVEMTAIKPGLNPVEPIYDMIKDQDTSSCWQVQHHLTSAGSNALNRIQTESSGQCHGNCYISAYKYKILNDQLTTFKWFLKRGCARTAEDPKENGSILSKEIFGLKITNTICGYKNGSLCNDHLNGYDPSLELKIQTIEPVKCYFCQTPANNSDPNEECYTVPVKNKPVKCPDETFTACFSTETAYSKANGEKIYQMSRGCSKDESGRSFSPVEGYTNVESVSTVCIKDQCNGGDGKTTDLVVAEEFESSNQISSETANQITANDSTSSNQSEVGDAESAAIINIVWNAIISALVLI